MQAQQASQLQFAGLVHAFGDLDSSIADLQEPEPFWHGKATYSLHPNG